MARKKVIKNYKGFNKDMSCRGFKYEEGKEFTINGEVELCSKGFHACKNPIDCLQFYTPYRSVYHMVEQSGTIKEEPEYEGFLNSKVVSSKIKIGKRLSLAELAKEAILYARSKIKHDHDYNHDYGGYYTAVNFANINSMSSHSYINTVGSRSTSVVSGLYGTAVNSGDCGAAISVNKSSISSNEGLLGTAVATGAESIAFTSGKFSASINTGDYGISTSTDYCSLSSTIGKYSASHSEGNYSISANIADFCTSYTSGADSISASSGDDSVCKASGYGSVAVATGDSCYVIANHETSIAIAWGFNGVAKGVKGSKLVLTEWEFSDHMYNLIDSRMIRIDGKRYKENTWYRLEDGKVVKADYIVYSNVMID